MLDSLLERLRKFVSTGNVAEQTVHGVVWVGSLNVVERLLQLLTMGVLARLLNPSQFGVFGIALVSLTAIKRFTDIGLDAALIQQTAENVDGYLNTVWSLEALRGLFIAAILFVSAPVLASFFGEPNATGPLRGIALTPVLLGLRNPAIIYFQKDLAFHREFIYRLTGSVTLPIVAIGYALIEQNVWALILGFVAADAVRLITSYIIDGYRPGLDFDREYAGELVNYGKWITGGSILNFLHNEGDDIVVGWLLSASALAFYQLSYRFANAPATEVGQTISKVAFPMFSKLQDDSELLRESFYRVLRVTTIISFPIAFGIAAVAPTFVKVFLGSKWLPMAATMQLLALYGLIRTLGKTWSPVWKTVGRPDYLAKLPVIRVVLMAIFIYPVTTTYGIEGTAALILGISIFPMLPVNLYLIVRTVDTTFRRLLTELSYPLASSIAMFLVTYSVQQRLELDPLIAEFALLVLLGAVTYVLCVLAFEYLFDWDVSGSARHIMQSM